MSAQNHDAVSESMATKLPTADPSRDDDKPSGTDLETARQDLRVLLALTRDSRTPWYVPVLMIGLVLWALSPADSIPDMVPLAGIFDDYAVFEIVRSLIYRAIPREYIDEHAARVARTSSRRVTGRAVLAGLLVIQVLILMGLGAVLLGFVDIGL